MTRRLGGQVIELGRKKGSLNVLDPGEAPEAAARLRAPGYPEAAEEVTQDALGVRLNMVESLITIRRGTPPTEREGTILSRALELLDARFDGVPVLGDLLALVREAPEELREAALDRGKMDRYKEITENLEASLVGLMPGGPFGDIFARHTTAPMRRDRAVGFDVSSIPHTDQKLRAAALLASWSAGFLTVDIAQILADAPSGSSPVGTTSSSSTSSTRPSRPGRGSLTAWTT